MNFYKHIEGVSRSASNWRDLVETPRRASLLELYTVRTIALECTTKATWGWMCAAKCQW